MKVSIVCPHCFKVESIEKKAFYSEEKCRECSKSLLEAMPVKGNSVILEKYVSHSDLPVIVDFWAPWCGPCLQMSPHFDKVSMAMPLEAQFLKINNDDEQSLGAKLQIASIPCVLVFKDGKEVDRFVGGRKSTEIEKWVRKYVGQDKI